MTKGESSMSELTAERVIEACGDRAQDGGITIQVSLEPLGAWRTRKARDLRGRPLSDQSTLAR